MNLSEMWLKPESGEIQECQICGKFQYPSIHSCNGVPKTEAAMERYKKRHEEKL